MSHGGCHDLAICAISGHLCMFDDQHHAALCWLVEISQHAYWHLHFTACSATFDPDTIANRLRELAFLNNAATIRFKAAKSASKRKAGAAKTNGSKAATSSDEDSSDEDIDSDGGLIDDPKEGWQVFHYSEGLKEYVKWVNSDRQAFHEPIVISREVKRTLRPGHAYCV